MDVIVIEPTGAMLLLKDVPSSPPLDFLQAVVKGYVERVPFFDSIESESGKRWPAVAFCNEEGKLNGLALNLVATLIWGESLHVDHGEVLTDMLVGNVVVVCAENAAELEEL